MCIVSAENRPLVKVKITFPSLYPHGAAPNFQFVNVNNNLPSSVAIQNQVKIIEVFHSST